MLTAPGNDRLAKERLAKLIKELRGHATQREFAKMLGTSYTAIQDWEKQVRLPKDINLGRIAKLKGWTQDELFRYLFVLDAQSEIFPADSLEIIFTHIQSLSLSQMQELSHYLKVQLSEVQNIKETSASCLLSEKQKHNLHVLLRASLREQSPTEAMARVGIAAELFTDVFCEIIKID